MKAKSKIKKAKPSRKSLVGKLKGASTTARRRAFKNNLPVAIYEDGKFFLVYRNNKKVEASAAEVEKLLQK